MSSNIPPLAAAVLPAGHGGEELASQEALFVRLRDYLAALSSGRPLVLLLDDLHWADPASLDLLRFLGRGLAALPLLLLATYRVDELTRRHPLYHLLPALVREARAARLDLGRLYDAAVRALVAARYALAQAEVARLAAYLRARAEGNPFFLGELLRALEADGILRPGTRAAGGGEGWALGDLADARVPPLLRQVIDGRVARLGDAARRALAVAAVLGQETPLDLWAAVAELPEETLLDVLERAAEAHLLAESPDGTRARFGHALIREALYEQTLPSRRRIWHRRVAEALLGAPDPDPDSVAFHLRRAGDPRAAAWLLQAGQRAHQAYAWG